MEQRRQAQADFDAQKNIYRQQTDNTKEKIAEVGAQIKEKELLLTAVADYAARRAELTFEQLSAGDVRGRLMEVVKQHTGRNYPMFVDDSESVVGIPRPTGQVFLFRVVANAPLSIKDFAETKQPQVSNAA